MTQAPQVELAKTRTIGIKMMKLGKERPGSIPTSAWTPMPVDLETGEPLDGVIHSRVERDVQGGGLLIASIELYVTGIGDG